MSHKNSAGPESGNQSQPFSSDSDASKVYIIVPGVKQMGKTDKETWFEYNYQLQLESADCNTSSRNGCTVVSQGKDTIYGADECTLEGKLNTATNELDSYFYVQRNRERAITCGVNAYEDVAQRWMENHPEEIVTVDKQRRR